MKIVLLAFMVIYVIPACIYITISERRKHKENMKFIKWLKSCGND